MKETVYKLLIHALFIVVAVYLYIEVVILWAGRWKRYFRLSGNFMYYVYLVLFTWVYTQILKVLWRWQVRLLHG